MTQNAHKNTSVCGATAVLFMVNGAYARDARTASDIGLISGEMWFEAFHPFHGSTDAPAGKGILEMEIVFSMQPSKRGFRSQADGYLLGFDATVEYCD